LADVGTLSATAIPVPDDGRSIARKRQRDLIRLVPVGPPPEAPHGVRRPAEDPAKRGVPAGHDTRGLVRRDGDAWRQPFGGQEPEAGIASAPRQHRRFESVAARALLYARQPLSAQMRMRRCKQQAPQIGHRVSGIAGQGDAVFPCESGGAPGKKEVGRVAMFHWRMETRLFQQ